MSTFFHQINNEENGTYSYFLLLLGGDYMISVSRDEILSHFAGSRQCYKLFINFILRLHVKRFIPARRDPSFVQPGSRFAGTKFSHVIASARLDGVKKLIKKYS